jgi:hypothetical protein
MKWKGKVKRVVKQDLKPDEAVEWQMWKKATENW